MDTLYNYKYVVFYNYKYVGRSIGPAVFENLGIHFA